MRGQNTPEFYVVLASVLIIFMIFTVIHQGQTINLYQHKDSTSAMNRAYSLASAINYVYLAGDGTSYNFTFQKFRNENVTINNGIVQCEKGESIGQAPLVTDNIVVTGELDAGNMIIRNNNGVVEIEQ